MNGTVILHVVQRPSAISLDFEAPIVQAGFNVKRIDDVYQAAARLIRSQPTDVLAVLVCIDNLDAPELEFFAIAAREWPDVPLYVYGRAMDARRRERALALGARAEVDPSHIVSALAARARISKVAPIQRDDEAEATTPDRPVSVAEPEPSTPAEPQQTTTDEPDTDETIPTPWQPSADRPQRVPPAMRTSRQTDDRRRARAAGATDDALLTPQEVSALLSDEPSEQESQD